MKYFKYDPTKEKPFESGEISKKEFKSLYLNFPWVEMLKKQNESKNEEVKCSPGIIIQNKDGIEIYISIVGNIEEYEFYICYKRPMLRKKRKWFRTIDYLDKNFKSIMPQQTKEEGLKASMYLFENDFQSLEDKYG